MRELERQQREQEENADRVYDMYTGNYISIFFICKRNRINECFYSRFRKNSSDFDDLKKIRNVL